MEKVWWWLKKAVYGVLEIKNGKKELLARIRKTIWHHNEGWHRPLQLALKAYQDIIDILAV